MKDLVDVVVVRTLVEITVIVGVRKTVIPKGTLGSVARRVALDAGWVNLLCHGMVFMMASELEAVTHERD